jgi:hypothetical protein
MLSTFRPGDEVEVRRKICDLLNSQVLKIGNSKSYRLHYTYKVVAIHAKSCMHAM